MIPTCLLSASVPSCRKTEISSTSGEFILSSPAIGSDSLLPSDYTCDGTSSTLPLKWTGVPGGTVSLALIMHHVASPADIHWYWVLYDIPPDVTSLPKNVSGIGISGTNSINDKRMYSPPCSQGPGIKAYTITLYALSAVPVPSVPADSVDRAALLDAIKDITISSSKMVVYYSRNVK